MRNFFKNMKVSFMLASILYIAFGVVLLLWPNTARDVICFAFGAVLLVYGAITIISFFVHESRSGVFRLELILGVVSAAVGILFLLKPELVVSILPVVLGVYVVIDGLLNVKRALELRDLSYRRWAVVLGLSLGSVALGAFLLIRPAFIAEVIIMVMGGILIYNGVSDLWTLFKLGRITKDMTQNGIVHIDPLDIE